ncbi:MarR family winged helix-turn-helix transcriptional regulator [Shinella oryzae]|uniref:MarR family winged helix-turn-helix transcriptional regulator n=1 Tax=Shinella oryzae TaxID=2871820 RepID=A0ABY9JZD8_9HYPH|nr:MarR family winged helix-turn-helix transcriptional regulator [Shinella oryzae]WLS01690.1 MarR family winged helix-turn-helix transcriptional regulator [Shinella oryzae]
MKLTDAQTKVLQYLAERPTVYTHPTGPEISTALGHVAYWASAKLASLEKKGLAERVGSAVGGGNQYRITPAGRNALDKERG